MLPILLAKTRRNACPHLPPSATISPARKHQAINSRTHQLVGLERVGGNNLVAVGENQFDFGQFGFAGAIAAFSASVSNPTVHVDHVSGFVLFARARFVLGDLPAVALNHFVSLVKQTKYVVSIGVEHTVVAGSIGLVVGMS